jgi:hypothetical protein
MSLRHCLEGQRARCHGPHTKLYVSWQVSPMSNAKSSRLGKLLTLVVYIAEVEFDFGNVSGRAASATIPLAANTVSTADVSVLLPKSVEGVVTIGFLCVNPKSLSVRANSTAAQSNLVEVEICVNSLEACC